MLRLAADDGVVARTFFVPARMEHVHLLASRLRSLELAEARAQDIGPHTMLRRGLRGSLWARTYFIDGEVGAMMGLGGAAIGDLGLPWLLTMAAAERVPVTFVKEGRVVVAEMLQQKPRLENYVLAGYRGVQRLLQAIGFVIDAPVPFGPNGALFCRFHTDRAMFGARIAQKKIRRPNAKEAPFIVYTAGRSRTHWLAAFLSYGNCRCHAEAAIKFRSFDDIKKFMSDPGVGSAETAAAPAWMLLEHFLPGHKRVVVRRPADDVIASFARAEVASLGSVDEDKLQRIVRYENNCLEKISRLPGTLTVDFADLDDESVCARIFEHCLPYRFDPAWWIALRDRIVEPDVASLWRYYFTNREAVDGFKRAARNQLAALVRLGEISRSQFVNA